MTVMIEPDTRGIDALSGKLDDSVASLQPLIFDELMREMADQFPAVPLHGHDLEFDGEPWLQLPTMEDLELLWSPSVPLQHQLYTLALKAHGGGPDLPHYMARQWAIADIELALIRKKEAEDAAAETVTGAADGAGSAGDEAVASAVPRRGGGDLPGGRQDGGSVGAGETAAAAQHPDTGGPSKVLRKRRSGKAGS